MTTPHDYPHTQLLIDGQWQDAADGRTLPVANPAAGAEIGRVAHAGIADLDVAGLKVWLASNGEEVLVAEQGGRAADYREEAGARIMQAAEITIRVDLGRGAAGATLWTCDFSYDYVKINADYRS